MTFLFLSAIMYFLPTMLARHKVDFMGIFLVNLFLGWTVIGWFVPWCGPAPRRGTFPSEWFPSAPGGFVASAARFRPRERISAVRVAEPFNGPALG